MLAMNINGDVIEDIFVDHSMMDEVDPREYYGLSDSQIDTFIMHSWYFETHGELLANAITEKMRLYGRVGAVQFERITRKQYETEWANVRQERGVIA